MGLRGMEGLSGIGGGHCRETFQSIKPGGKSDWARVGLRGGGRALDGVSCKGGRAISGEGVTADLHCPECIDHQARWLEGPWLGGRGLNRVESYA